MFLQRFALGVVVLSLCACEAKPSKDLPVWKASDHDHAEELARGAAPTEPGTKAPKKKGEEEAELADLVWGSKCATCHGELGRGDGPTGSMVNATNLADPKWQASVTDEQIVTAIVQGKGKMPKFELPIKAVAGLVIKIRTLKNQ